MAYRIADGFGQGRHQDMTQRHHVQRHYGIMCTTQRWVESTIDGPDWDAGVLMWETCAAPSSR